MSKTPVPRHDNSVQISTKSPSATSIGISAPPKPRGNATKPR